MMSDSISNQLSQEEGKPLRQGSNLMSLLDSGYVLLGLDGMIVDANSRLGDMLGFSKEDLLGSNFFHHWVKEQQGVLFTNQVVFETLVRDYKVEITHRDGYTLLGSMNAQFLENGDKKQLECLLTIDEKTEERKLDFDKTLRNVTGGIAHLINNQMASVVGTADLIKAELGGDKPELCAQLDRITDSGMQASDVAHKLIDYAQSIELAILTDVNLYEVISEVAKKYKKDRNKSHPRQLIFNVHKMLPTIQGNHELLVKLLTSLLENAVEATEDNGVIIISSKVAKLPKEDADSEGKYLGLYVEDHGHGMSQVIQHRIFEPFFSTRFMGRGMSLAHALKIVKVHDGRIHVKTGVGKGSIFKTYFPIPEKQEPLKPA